MLRSYRHIGFALVGWLSLANAQNQTAQPEQPKAEANQADPAPTIPPPPAKAVEPVEPSELYRPCDKGDNARNSDLCAQWKAADAARDAANWTFWGVMLGVIGTFGLFWTLYYTRAAVKAAQDATKDADAAIAIAERNADAASAQVDVAQDTAKKQLRAYMGTLQGFVHDALGSPHLVVEIKNFGATPAFNLRYESNVSMFRKPAVGNPNRIDWFGLVGVFGQCEPGHTQNAAVIIDRPIDRSLTDLVIYEVILTFRDVFDQPRWRRITYVIGPLSRVIDGRLIMDVPENGNDEGEGDPPESLAKTG